MRIGIDVRPALFSRAGISRYTAELVRALLALPEGPRLALYGDAWTSPLRDARLDPMECSERATYVRRRIPGRLSALLGRAGFGVESRLGPIDVFHYTDFVYPPVRRAPTVVSVHDVSFLLDPTFHDPGFGRALEARLVPVLARAARVLVPSSETAGQVAERLGVRSARVVVAPYGADHALRPADPAAIARLDARLARAGRARGNLRADRPLLVAVGTVEPRKNHLRLLEAFERADAAGETTLCIVGAYGWRCDAERAAIESAVARGRVVHLADAEDAWIPELLRRATGSVYVSRYEGFGFPLVEAMALGCPVLTTRRGSLAEIGGDAVLHCDPDDTGSIERGLRELLGSSAARTALADAGRARASRYTWEATARAHLRAYEEAARG